MEIKACLLFIVSLLLAVIIINADGREWAEAGEYCLSANACCSGSCLTLQARCAGSSGGILYLAGFQPPSIISPMEQYSNQTNFTRLGSACHTISCCKPYCCGKTGKIQTLAAPSGFIAPIRPIPLQKPGQLNCAGYGTLCHSTNCCTPYRCINYSLRCIY